MKLLIVDDSKEIREILKTICSHLFNTIIECDDGSSAIKIFYDEKPDWVLMDIKMKELDGITATKEIISRYPDAKIVIVSQYDDKRIIEASKKSGAKDFVNKDDLIRIEEIIKTNEV